MGIYVQLLSCLLFTVYNVISYSPRLFSLFIYIFSWWEVFLYFCIKFIRLNNCPSLEACFLFSSCAVSPTSGSETWRMDKLWHLQLPTFLLIFIFLYQQLNIDHESGDICVTSLFLSSSDLLLCQWVKSTECHLQWGSSNISMIFNLCVWNVFIHLSSILQACDTEVNNSGIAASDLIIGVLKVTLNNYFICTD